MENKVKKKKKLIWINHRKNLNKHHRLVMLDNKKYKDFLWYKPIKYRLRFFGKDKKKMESIELFENRVLFFPIWRVLFQYYGINRRMAFFFCELFGWLPCLLYSELNRHIGILHLENVVAKIRIFCDYSLYLNVLRDCKTLISIRCWRGYRHCRGRTTRGQCTRTNGNTARVFLCDWQKWFDKICGNDPLFSIAGSSKDRQAKYRLEVLPLYSKSVRRKNQMMLEETVAVKRKKAKMRRRSVFSGVKRVRK